VILLNSSESFMFCWPCISI